MKNKPVFDEVVRHYEACLERHGTGAEAVNWKSQNDAEIRYRVMVDVLKGATKPVNLLDFGCGLCGLLEFIRGKDFGHISYSGLDVSARYVAAAQEQFPDAELLCGDVLDTAFDLPGFDVIVMNGVFTRRENIAHTEMVNYTRKLVTRLFEACRFGLAFNVMSSNVDWKDDRLFYPSLDELGELCGKLTRNFVIRSDYGLYETTVYLYTNTLCERSPD